MTNVVQTFPAPSAPFVDVKTGRINEAWRSFLDALWRRTGGAQGAPAGSGTVTSVAAASTSGDIVVSGSPITVTGTLELDLAAQAGVTAGAGYNTFSVNAKGIVTAASAVSYQPLDADLTALGALATDGFAKRAAGAWAVSASVSLTADVSGTLPVGNGGTGLATYTLGDILYSSASNTLARLAGNTTTSKMRLTQTGNGTVSAAPVWEKEGWDYLGGVAPIGSASTTLLANTTIAARDFLYIVVGITGYAGGGSVAEITFNNSATGHTYRFLVNAAGGTTWAAGTNTGSNGGSFKVGPSSVGAIPRTVILEIENRPDNSEKPVLLRSLTGKGASGTQNDIDIFTGSFYAGAATQITSVKVTAAAAINAGSFVQIYGRNATA